MKSPAAAVLLVAGIAPVLSGCAAAIVPVAAAGVIGKKRFVRHKHGKEVRVVSADAMGTDGANVQLVNLTQLPPPDGSVPRTDTPASAQSGAVPPAMQFLYGSGEAEALSMQAFLRVADVMIAKSNDRAVGLKVFSAVLAPGSTLAAPKFLPCYDKPLAVIFDVDETALLNLGYEADDAQRRTGYDPARWNAWEKTGQNAVAAAPGMAEVARVANASGVTLVFNTNRLAANAAQTEATLIKAGLGPVAHGRNLWLQGDDGDGSSKDARRTAIAQRYCVIAMAGDQLGDFSDLFNAPGLTPAQRRALAGGTEIKMLWGHSWFILPNPVYGTALKGRIDDVFPADKRWTDPGSAALPAPTGAK